MDIVPERVDLVNNRKSPIQDDYIEAYLAGYKAEKDESVKSRRAREKYHNIGSPC